jgi:hypothetical protein
METMARRSSLPPVAPLACPARTAIPPILAIIRGYPRASRSSSTRMVGGTEGRGSLRKTHILVNNLPIKVGPVFLEMLSHEMAGEFSGIIALRQRVRLDVFDRRAPLVGHRQHPLVYREESRRDFARVRVGRRPQLNPCFRHDGLWLSRPWT